MTRLLVSVRSAEEALAGLQGGADLIDIKEPLRGALGAAEVSVWRAVNAAIERRVPISAALGELLDSACLTRAAQAQGFTYVKAGLAGCAKLADWVSRWRQLQQALPSQVELVAVIYADFERAEAPTSDQVIAATVELGLKTLLVDTFDKSHGDLEACLSARGLQRLLTAAKAHRLQVALAGSLTEQTIPAVLPLSPDWLAVRGAACRQGQRTGAVCSERVARLRALLS